MGALLVPAEKRCCDCREIKATSLFYANCASKDGLQYRCKECSKRAATLWRVNNTDQNNGTRRARYARDPQRFRNERNEHRKNNLEHERLTDRLWCEKNVEKRKASKSKTQKKAWRENPEFRLMQNWRGRIARVIAGKNGGSEDFLGCTWDQFLGHLEILFTPGMSWDNYGEWHVDHIRPLSRFNLSDPAQQRAAFHWSNHQPLWAEDNLSKGAKLL
jgi:hypothetical protein